MKKLKDMTIEERREYFHNYYLNHREAYINRSKKYNSINAEKIKEERKDYWHLYYLKHRERKLEQQKEYYERHREEIKKKANNRYRIKCGLKPLAGAENEKLY